MFVACECCVLSGLECDSFTFTFTRGMIRGTLCILNLGCCLMMDAVSCVHAYFLTVTRFSKDLLLKLFSSGQCKWVNCIMFFTLAHCF